MQTKTRRRYIRHEIKLAATIMVDNSHYVQCTIRNFCSGGLLLELHQTEQALIPQKDILIIFSINTKQGLENYRQTAKIMRIDTNDIGVAFEKNSDITFEALTNESQKSLGLASADKPKNPTYLSKQKQLEADFTHLLKESLAAMMNDFCQRVEIDLVTAAEKTKIIPENTALIDASINLREKNEILLNEFIKITQNENYLALNRSDKSADGLDNEQSSLSLLDKDDFEDWLNLSSVIKSLESQYCSELDQIQKKIAFLTKVHKNKTVNPASPEKICASFQKALDSVNESLKIKQILYTLFEKVLSKYLPDIYKRMDTILIENGAPKKIINEAEWLKVNPEPNSKPSKPEPHRGQSDFATHPAVNNYAPSNSKPTTHSSPNFDQQSSSNAYDEISNSTQESNIKKNFKPIVDVANNLLQLIQGKDFPQASEEQSVSDSSKYSTEEINSALSHLQDNFSEHGFLASSSNKLTTDLTQTLDSFSDSEKNLSNTDKKNLQVYERLFEVLFNGIIQSEDIKQYLERIHLPIMGQAMLDPNFLESENNAAKNIVNHLFFLEPAVQENRIIKNKNIKQTLDTLMSQLSEKSLTNNDIFYSVEQQLGDISEFINNSIDRNIKRIIESYDGKQNLERARYSVQKKINQCFADKNIPKIIIALLEAGWQHHLVMLTLNKDNTSFQIFLGVINNLTTWLTTSEPPSSKLAKKTLKFIDENLKSVCTNTFLHDEIIENISSLLLKNLLLPGSDAMKLVSLEPIYNNQPPKLITEIQQLHTGDWFNFLNHQKVDPLKLIWIGKLTNTYVFVNRSGIKKLELKAKDLADKLHHGDAYPIESLDLPVMNRATNSMLQKMHDKLIHDALHDPTTQLLNRREFIKQLKQLQSNPSQTSHLLFNIEIHDFRLITTSCGLDGRDALLKQFSLLLKDNVSDEAIISRLDNKIFAILLKNQSTNNTQSIADDILSKLINTQFKWQDKSYPIAISIGVVPFLTGTAFSLDNTLQKADYATLSARSLGKNRVQIHTEEDKQLISQYNIHEWVGHIDQVFAEDRLFLRCQKITALEDANGARTHYEILLGIKDEKGNVIPPDEFIPAVESCQRMSEIDRWVVNSVFYWVENNAFDFEMLDGFSINLSGESLNDPSFLTFLKQKLSTSPIDLGKITFEITETVAAENFIFTQNFIKEIKHFNCKFSLDDFGSGYSSYTYLKSLDVDYLKIDGAFIKDILENDADVAIVKSMNEISHALGLETIAEYVENNEIQEFLKEIGIDYVQGWNIQKPILLNDLV